MGLLGGTRLSEANPPDNDRERNAIPDKALQAEGTGTETTTDSSENQGSSQEGDTKSDTVENGKDQAETIRTAFIAWAATHFSLPSEADQDAFLQVLILSWPHLGPEARSQIMAIVCTEDEKARSQPSG